MKKMAKFNKGLSPLIIVIVVAIILLSAGFFFYQRGSLPVSLPGVPVLNQRVQESDFDFVDDPIVKKHLVAQTNQTSYRTKTRSYAADLNFVTELQIKGEEFNSREIQQDSSSRDTKHKLEIGNTIFIKDFLDNQWWKQTITPQEEKELPEEKKPEEPVDFKQVYSKPDLKFKSLGKEACGPSAPDSTCYKYEQTIAEAGELSTARTFWFDDKKYLLRKEEANTGEFKVSSEYSYDGINIIPPSPTKDVPAGKNIYDYYYGYDSNANAPSESELKKLQQQFGGSMDEKDLQNYTLPDNLEVPNE